MPTHMVDKHGNVVFLERPSVKVKENSLRTRKTLGKGKNQPPPGFVQCPECKVTLKSTARLKTHLRRVHGKAQAEISARSSSFASIGTEPSHAGDVTGFSTHRASSTRQSQEAIDGSRGIGHFARESGRFGSYPTHDDYGDESSAE